MNSDMPKCDQCGQVMVIVDGYGCCPDGHGRLIVLSEAERNELRRAGRTIVQADGIPPYHTHTHTHTHRKAA